MGFGTKKRLNAEGRVIGRGTSIFPQLSTTRPAGNFSFPKMNCPHSNGPRKPFHQLTAFREKSEVTQAEKQQKAVGSRIAHVAPLGHKRRNLKLDSLLAAFNQRLSEA